MATTNRKTISIDSYGSGDEREVLSAYSLDFSNFRIIKEALGGLARHDIEVECKDGEWRRLGEVIESDEIDTI